MARRHASGLVSLVLLFLLQLASTRNTKGQSPAFPTGDFAHRVLAGETPPPQLTGVTFRITRSGEFLVMNGEQVVARYGYNIAGDRFNLWGSSPEAGCVTPALIIGVYRWWLEDGAIRFQLLDDACPGRPEIAAAARLAPIAALPAGQATPSQ